MPGGNFETSSFPTILRFRLAFCVKIGIPFQFLTFFNIAVNMLEILKRQRHAGKIRFRLLE